MVLRSLSQDGRLLFTTRIVRLFAYGLLSVVLALYLAEIGLNDSEIGFVLSVALAGDVAVSLLMTSIADRAGRRRVLMTGAMLMVFAGVIFAITRSLVPLTIAAFIGTLSPTGNEVGPFLSIEQAALSQTVADRLRTRVFAWYSLSGSLATAAGAFSGGFLSDFTQDLGLAPQEAYRGVVLLYGFLGLTLAAVFSRLSLAVEPPRIHESAEPKPDGKGRALFGLRRSRGLILRLSGLFMLDAFAGGLIIQSLMAYWFHVRFGVSPTTLGSVFFGANLFAGFSALAAARLAGRIGLVNTMVWTHIPSNVLLMMVPLMPSLGLAIAVLLARFAISQMDVPTRQSYTMAVVDPPERAAAAGVTNVSRTAASSAGPLITGALFSASLFSVPFLVAGSLKIVYDLLLYRGFRTIRPPEEHT
jgi:MFS family permease